MYVQLVSATRSPISTLLSAWQISRSKHSPLLPAYIDLYRSSVVRSEEFLNSEHKFTHPDLSIVDGKLLIMGQPIEELLNQIFNSNLPVTETVQFTFCFEDVPVAFREQAVRSTQGTSFWLQTSRITDFSEFATKGEYYIPPELMSNPQALAKYRESMKRIQDMYNELVAMGVNTDHARAIMPYYRTERGNYTYNLRALIAIIRQRSCWIASSFWTDIVAQIMKILLAEDPLFALISTPPCCDSKGKYKACPYSVDMDKRIKGTDPLELCPIYVKSELATTMSAIRDKSAAEISRQRYEQFYKNLWAGVASSELVLE